MALGFRDQVFVAFRNLGLADQGMAVVVYRFCLWLLVGDSKQDVMV